MTTALSIDSFVELVKRSRLLSAPQIQQALEELEAEGVECDSADELADALVRRELLTRWQVGFLLKGKHSGFFLGSYRFLKMLGKGGMGAVYLAEHEMMRRRCAIKVLPTKLIAESSSVLERFYLEAQAVAALDDPNVVRAYDVNKEVQGKREIHYLVMEYVDGCDLQVFVQRKGPLDYVQAADFARQAASGLAHAHECGLIHRDIKPANLLIDERGTVKILDLGLARFFDDRLDASLTTTHNESILGTADYLSPEQALDSHNVDTRTDIYSLGCTCYFMLTGHPPFPDGSVAQRLMSHQTKSPKAIEKIRTDVPRDLVTIVERMIAKNRDDRYQSCREVGAAFTTWLAEHADEEWKQQHQGVLDGSDSRMRAEPTRSKSAGTEETSLDLGNDSTDILGLAPTEDDDLKPSQSNAKVDAENSAQPVSTSSEQELGLDQLEELDPLAPEIDPGSSSGSLDNLLNEALDNYPALDSNPNLGTFPVQAAMDSGTRVAAKPKLFESAESKQLIRLLLIGFAVSVPLSIVILVVSSQFETPVQTENTSVAYNDPSEPVESLDDPTTDAASPSEPPAKPVESKKKVDPGATTQDPESKATVESVAVGEPVANGEDLKPTPNEPLPNEPDPVAAAAPAADVAAQATSPEASASTTSPAVLNPNEPMVASKLANTPPKKNKNSDAPNDAQVDVDKGKGGESSGPPTAEEITKLIGDLTKVTITLDREVKNAYDFMVIRTAQESLERAGLKVNLEPKDGDSAVLTLSLDAERDNSFTALLLAAELKCRDKNGKEVTVWKLREEVARVKSNLLGPTPPTVLRRKFSDFYTPFTREYRQAITAN